MMSEALVHYRRALQLAHHDIDLQHRVQEVTHASPAPKPPPPKIEELFDFDSLMAQLDPAGAHSTEFVPLRVAPSAALDAVAPAMDDRDSFAVMERQLREREEQRVLDERQARQGEAERKRRLVLEELEDWLAAIALDRQRAAGSQPSL
jgi:hypothetical protein